jgi:hypothetical protein
MVKTLFFLKFFRHKRNYESDAIRFQQICNYALVAAWQYRDLFEK